MKYHPFSMSHMWRAKFRPLRLRMKGLNIWKSLKWIEKIGPLWNIPLVKALLLTFLWLRAYWMLFPNLIPVSPFGDKVFLACLPRSSSYVSLSCVFFKALPKFHLSRLHLPPNHLYSYLPNRVQSYSAIHFLPYRRFDGFLDSCVQFGSEKTGGEHL